MDQCTKDFHVSIIGGGIGGISAAIGMLRKGIAVHVFESAVSTNTQPEPS